MQTKTSTRFFEVILVLMAGLLAITVTATPATAELEKMSDDEIANVHAQGLTGELTQGNLENLDEKTIDRSMKLADKVMSRMMKNAENQSSGNSDRLQKLETAQKRLDQVKSMTKVATELLPIMKELQGTGFLQAFGQAFTNQ